MLVNFNKISQEIMRIDSNGSVGIGTSIPNLRIQSYSIWSEILENAERTPALKIALENLINLHNLTKDHGNSKT